VSNLDKEISKISYNYLNLPDTVLLTGTNRRVTYQYDAEGNKVREVLVNGGTTVTRDYVGEFVFVNNAIDHLIHEEGRVAYESGTPRYEFFVKDHLGNVRQVIRGPQGGAYRIATMEPENEESEKEYFENITESRQGAAEHNVTEGGYAVAWLNADRGRILGPARTQEIQEGDTINLSVFGTPMPRGWIRRNSGSCLPVSSGPETCLLWPVSSTNLDSSMLEADPINCYWPTLSCWCFRS
jgi:YD repeat-containing protein